MNWNRLGLLTALIIASLSTLPLYAVEIPVPSIPEIPDVDQTLLPDSFPIYVDGTSVMSHPALNYTETFLPTNNDYKKNPGCYVACYSLNKEGSIYAANNTDFVIGQIRVAGSYDESTCVPTGYEKKDIRKEPTFIKLCRNSFKPCKNGHCFAAGNTGGWFVSS